MVSDITNKYLYGKQTKINELPEYKILMTISNITSYLPFYYQNFLDFEKANVQLNDNIDYYLKMSIDEAFIVGFRINLCLHNYLASLYSYDCSLRRLKNLGQNFKPDNISEIHFKFIENYAILRSHDAFDFLIRLRNFYQHFTYPFGLIQKSEKKPSCLLYYIYINDLFGYINEDPFYNYKKEDVKLKAIHCLERIQVKYIEWEKLLPIYLIIKDFNDLLKFSLKELIPSNMMEYYQSIVDQANIEFFNENFHSAILLDLIDNQRHLKWPFEYIFHFLISIGPLPLVNKSNSFRQNYISEKLKWLEEKTIISNEDLNLFRKIDMSIT